MIKRHFGLAALVASSLLLFSPAAKAALYQFDVNTGGAIEAFGFFTTDTANGLAGNIISVTGSVIGGPNPGAISFTPGSGSDSFFFWDNQLFPSANPKLSGAGVLFYTATYEYNAWGNGPDNYSFWAAPRPGVEGGVISADNVEGFIKGVPELSTWAMMLIGFAGIGFAAYRRSIKIAAEV
jgi:hypothetical protein